jgi:hypothetical protein
MRELDSMAAKWHNLVTFPLASVAQSALQAREGAFPSARGSLHYATELCYFAAIEWIRISI